MMTVPTILDNRSFVSHGAAMSEQGACGMHDNGPKGDHMASKYAGLKHRIPEQPTARDAALTAELAAIETETLAELTAGYNTCKDAAGKLAEQVKQLSVRLEAREILIRRALDAQGATSVRMQGYTWSEKFEPYPVTEDPAAVVRYFREHGLEDQLTLTASELNGRLKNLVKEEALANELQVDVVTVVDPATGAEQQTTEVRSRVPGVRVFLKAGLSRVKGA
jgi:hypothetical protein